MADKKQSEAEEIAALPQLGSEPRQTVEVKFEVKAGIGELVLMNDVPLSEDLGSGVWKARVGKGDYKLRWLADSGHDDEAYTVAVTAPECAAFNPPQLRTDKKGRARGHTTIRVCAPGGGGGGGALAVVAALLFAVSPATSQEAPLVTAPAPVLGATLRTVPAPVLYLTAGTEEKRARIEAEVASWSGGNSEFSRSHLVLAASAPLAGGDEPTVLADLRGLGGATTVSATLNGWTRGPLGTTQAIEDWCVDARDERRLAADFQCGEKPGSIFDAAKLPDLMMAEHDVVAGGELRLLWAVAAEVGRQTVNYLREDDFAPEVAETTPWSVEGKVGTLVNAAGGINLVSVGARWQRSFQVGSPADICTPVGTGGALRCRNRPVGAPAEERESVLDVQVRRFLNPRFAINPHLSYAIDGGATGFELPIYVVANADGALIAGMTPSWNSEDDRVRLTLFVGKAFEFGL
jgi:hypothetical protein